MMDRYNASVEKSQVGKTDSFSIQYKKYRIVAVYDQPVISHLYLFTWQCNSVNDPCQLKPECRASIVHRLQLRNLCH